MRTQRARPARCGGSSPLRHSGSGSGLFGVAEPIHTGFGVGRCWVSLFAGCLKGFQASALLLDLAGALGLLVLRV